MHGVRLAPAQRQLACAHLVVAQVEVGELRAALAAGHLLDATLGHAQPLKRGLVLQPNNAWYPLHVDSQLDEVGEVVGDDFGGEDAVGKVASDVALRAGERDLVYLEF